ncbi:MAG: hypothetical protein P8Z37_06225 [Acidobacteriota bacterium]
MGNNQSGIHVGRRDFIRATTFASMAAALPATSFAESTSVISSKPSPAGRHRNLVFLSNTPENYEKFIESIKSIREYDVNVITMKGDFEKPQEILASLQGKDADILLMRLPSVGMTSRHIAEGMGTLDFPVILLPASADLILLETDLAAAFQLKGTNAIVAHSEERALELVKLLSAPRVLEGKKALIFGRPYDSTTVPEPNLNDGFILKRTGVRMEHRPMQELIERMKSVDEAAARREMERWKREASKIVEPSDEEILKSSKLYVLLRNIVDEEDLSAISIDCLSYSFGNDTTLPTPCLAFTRLRDEGVSAPCEADICMMLASMVMQEIGRKPSYVSNVSSADSKTSSTVLRHCVTPLKIHGLDSEPVPYVLRDYHVYGRGVTAEMEFPVGMEITMGGFSKDLKSFVLWPGKIQSGKYDIETPSFENAPPGMENMRKFCSNRAEVKINDVNGFLKHIAGIHNILIAGNHSQEICDAMLRMNVNVIAPPDLTPPEV